MAVTAFNVAKGMTVYGCDGQKIGTVGELLSGQPENTDSEGTPYSDVRTTSGDPGSGANPEAGGSRQADTTLRASPQGATDASGGLYATNLGGTPAVGVAPDDAVSTGVTAGDPGVTLTPSDTKYFEVKHGGILGIGGDHLYVPFSAVEAVAPGDSVTLACTLADCASRFGERPAPLQETPANGG
jgi:hypothetical protein